MNDAWQVGVLLYRDTVGRPWLMLDKLTLCFTETQWGDHDWCLTSWRSDSQRHSGETMNDAWQVDVLIHRDTVGRPWMMLDKLTLWFTETQWGHHEWCLTSWRSDSQRHSGETMNDAWQVDVLIHRDTVGRPWMMLDKLTFWFTETQWGDHEWCLISWRSDSQRHSGETMNDAWQVDVLIHRDTVGRPWMMLDKLTFWFTETQWGDHEWCLTSWRSDLQRHSGETMNDAWQVDVLIHRDTVGRPWMMLDKLTFWFTETQWGDHEWCLTSWRSDSQRHSGETMNDAWQVDVLIHRDTVGRPWMMLDKLTLWFTETQWGDHEWCLTSWRSDSQRHSGETMNDAWQVDVLIYRDTVGRPWMMLDKLTFWFTETQWGDHEWCLTSWRSDSQRHSGETMNDAWQVDVLIHRDTVGRPWMMLDKLTFWFTETQWGDHEWCLTSWRSDSQRHSGETMNDAWQVDVLIYRDTVGRPWMMLDKLTFWFTETQWGDHEWCLTSWRSDSQRHCGETMNDAWQVDVLIHRDTVGRPWMMLDKLTFWFTETQWGDHEWCLISWRSDSQRHSGETMNDAWQVDVLLYRDTVGRPWHRSRLQVQNVVLLCRQSGWNLERLSLNPSADAMAVKLEYHLIIRVLGQVWNNSKWKMATIPKQKQWWNWYVKTLKTTTKAKPEQQNQHQNRKATAVLTLHLHGRPKMPLCSVKKISQIPTIEH